MWQIFIEGFLLQASLIFALGAQNLFVLESGLRRQHHIAVSVTCFFCDLAIIMMGVMGMAGIMNSFPQFKIIFGLLGAGFMVYYGLNKMRAREDDLLMNKTASIQDTLKKSVLSAVTFSIVNPHAYLDGIVLIGGYATKYEALDQRVAVGFGAAIYSLVWFLILSSASARLMPVLSNPRRMRRAMSLSGLVLVFLSFKLSVDVYGWLIESLETSEIILQAQH